MAAMDTYEFVETWTAVIPSDWTLEAGFPGKEFVSVFPGMVTFMQGVGCRGIPEPHLQRMIDQGLLRKIVRPED